jgi:hypothetical protein
MAHVLILILALLLPASAQAGTIVSARADTVSITVYRQPGRAKGAIDRDWPRGYALVTETRTVDLPQGESVVRFEGVAEGLLPETAVLSGFPRGVREKNRDARVLSPAGLIDAYLKRRVTLQRTDRKSGKVREQEAIISAGPGGGVIVQTQEGYEALGCSGLPERMLYPGAPADLSPRPTLSVIASSDRPVRAVLQLTYLAEGFDWSASYVADMRSDGMLDLMAWLTLANGGVTGFADARLSVIAGQPNRRYAWAMRPVAPPLRLRCWPMDITSTHPAWQLFPVQQPDMRDAAAAEEVVVTGMRRSGAVKRPVAALPPPPPPPPPPPAPPPPPPNVGARKILPVPFPVDVAAKGQKQVALLRREGVRVERLYAATVTSGSGESRPMTLRLRLHNRKADGLGLAMPSGQVAVFDTVGDLRLLAGEVDVADKAEGERVDYDLAAAPDVRITTRMTAQKAGKARMWTIAISNARPFMIEAEVVIPQNIRPRPADLERRGASWIWRTGVPANGSADYRYEEPLRP